MTRARLRILCWFIALAAVMDGPAGLSLAAATAPPSPPAATQPATLPSPPAVAFDPPELQKIYQAELGGMYDPGQFSEIYNAHVLLEQYFLSTSSAQREECISRIDALGVDRAALGRIARIHLDWTALVPGVYYVNEKVGPYDVRYFFGVPKGYDRAQSWPLVIKLPTPQAFLTDPAPDAEQVAKIYTQWVTDEFSAHPDAVVLMPLLNLDLLFGPSKSGMNLVIQPMLHITTRVNIDPARVYLMGHSTAAQAVWNIALHYPTYFAAINSLAGSAPFPWQRLRLGNLRNVLPVIWHDASDNVIRVDESRSIVKYLRGMKYDVDYEETADLGHVPTPPILDQEYGKLRGRTRELYPKEIFLQSDKPETIFNREDWIQIYQPIDTGDEQKYMIAHSGEYMILDQKSFRAVGTITDRNTITLTTINVQTLRLYLNDRMVDLSQPLTVIANGRQRFKGIVPQSTAEMLNDQRFLGRGWRYFTAVLDLDLTEPTTQPSTESTTQPSHHGSIDIVLPNGEHETYTPK